MFSGGTSWDQYCQVSVRCHRPVQWVGRCYGRLQLLSQLEGDALNVALLVHEVKRAKRVGLVGALTEHYGSPGRLADYRRQFERTTRQEGEDPSTFAIALETLAVKAFGDMGANARLRLIRDRFVAGHENCALHRHLDSGPPETPIRDIVDRCRVWESHTDSGVRRIVKPVPEMALPVYTVDEPACVPADRAVAAVTAHPAGPSDLEALLCHLLPTAPIPPPQPKPTELEILLKRLLSGVSAGYRKIATETLDELCMWRVNPQSGSRMCYELSYNIAPNKSPPAMSVWAGVVRGVVGLRL